ncbi:hypothetical protein Hanom_Chr01g00020541 [Helianthus anomalus]
MVCSKTEKHLNTGAMAPTTTPIMLTTSKAIYLLYVSNFLQAYIEAPKISSSVD